MNHTHFITILFFSHFPLPPKIVSFLPLRKWCVLDFFVHLEAQVQILYLHVGKEAGIENVYISEASL